MDNMDNINPWDWRFNLMPGDRVLVFDRRRYKDDVSTPSLQTMCPATIVCRYGIQGRTHCYPDNVDVVFDHTPDVVSTSHFTYGVQKAKQ